LRRSHLSPFYGLITGASGAVSSDTSRVTSRVLVRHGDVERGPWLACQVNIRALAFSAGKWPLRVDMIPPKGRHCPKWALCAVRLRPIVPPITSAAHTMPYIHKTPQCALVRASSEGSRPGRSRSAAAAESQAPFIEPFDHKKRLLCVIGGRFNEGANET
jgi:hypothetical protein